MRSSAVVNKLHLADARDVGGTTTVALPFSAPPSAPTLSPYRQAIMGNNRRNIYLVNRIKDTFNLRPTVPYPEYIHHPEPYISSDELTIATAIHGQHGDHWVHALVDTGAGASLISKEFLSRLHPDDYEHIPLAPVDRFVSVTGHALQILGKAIVSISFTVDDGQTVDSHCVFYVINELDCAMILGRKHLYKFFHTINLQTGEITALPSDSFSIPVYVSKAITVPPFSVKQIPLFFKSLDEKIERTIDVYLLPQLLTSNGTPARYHVWQTSITLDPGTYNKPYHFFTTIVNDSSLPYHFPTNHTFGELIPVDDLYLEMEDWRGDESLFSHRVMSMKEITFIPEVPILPETQFDSWLNHDPDEYSNVNMVNINPDLPEEQRKAIFVLCKKYQGIFNSDNKAPPPALDPNDLTKHVMHHIPTGNSSPVNIPRRRMNPVKLARLSKKVDELLKAKHIRPSTSAYSSPPHLVPKANGEDRLTIDYRMLNSQTVHDAYPLPNIIEIFDTYTHCRYFALIDLAAGYHQILMDPKDAAKTAFPGATGLYEWVVMPEGLKTAPATFQRFMNNVLGPLLKEGTWVYIDDITCGAKTFEEFLEKLERLFKRLEMHKLTCKAAKTYLGYTKLKILGNIIGDGERRTNPKLVQAVNEFPIPRTVKQLQAWIGLVNYYRSFIPRITDINAPLYQLVRKDKKWEWTPECQQAFDEIKRILTTDPVLKLPDWSKTFIIETDASDKAIAAVLSQEYDSKLFPIAYVSRTLSAAEKNYSTTEKECLAIVYAIQQFNHYIFGHKAIIRTDHSALQWMHKLRGTNSRLERWAIQLGNYDITFEHIPGKLIPHVDALSRAGEDNYAEHKRDSKVSNKKKRAMLSQELLESAAKDAHPTKVNMFHPASLSVLTTFPPFTIISGKRVIKKGPYVPYHRVFLIRTRAASKKGKRALIPPPSSSSSPSITVKIRRPPKRKEQEERIAQEEKSKEEDYIAATYRKEFEVERIVDHRTNDKGETEFFVKWKGYDSSRNTWEPADHLDNAKLAIYEYLNDLKEREGQARELPILLKQYLLNADERAQEHGKPQIVVRDQPIPEVVLDEKALLRNNLYTDDFISDVAILQAEDPQWQKIIDYLSNNITPSHLSAKEREIFIKEAKNYVIAPARLLFQRQVDILFRVIKNTRPLQSTTEHSDSAMALVIPEARRHYVMDNYHQSLFAGHLGIKRTYARIASQFWWPNMFSDVYNYVTHCIPCQQFKRGALIRYKRMAMPVAQYPFHIVAVDYIGKIHTSSDGCSYIIVFIDHFSKWTIAVPTKSQDAAAFARIFLEQVVCKFGAPEFLLSDRGSGFLNDFTLALLQQMRIKKLNISAYHPQTNGQVERVNGTILDMIKTTAIEKSDWAHILQPLIFAYNTSIHESLQESPYFVLFGHQARQPFGPTSITPALAIAEDAVMGRVNEIVDHFTATREYVKEKIKQAQEKYLRDENGKPTTLPVFSVGDKVFYKSIYRPTSGETRKFLPTWIGPYVILKRHSEVTYTIKQFDVENAIPFVTHVTRLKPYRSSRESQQRDEGPIPSTIIDLSQDETMEEKKREERNNEQKEEKEAATETTIISSVIKRSNGKRKTNSTRPTRISTPYIPLTPHSFH